MTSDLGNAKVSRMRDEIIDTVITKAGGTTALAKAIGVQPPSIYSWERIPPRHVPRISQLTDIPRHELRPDLWQEVDAA